MSEVAQLALWVSMSGSTMRLMSNGDLIGCVRSGRPTRINMRAAGNARRTRWTMEEAQRRADEYGFTREEQA